MARTPPKPPVQPKPLVPVADALQAIPPDDGRVAYVRAIVQEQKEGLVPLFFRADIARAGDVPPVEADRIQPGLRLLVETMTPEHLASSIRRSAQDQRQGIRLQGAQLAPIIGWGMMAQEKVNASRRAALGITWPCTVWPMTIVMPIDDQTPLQGNKYGDVGPLPTFMRVVSGMLRYDGNDCRPGRVFVFIWDYAGRIRRAVIRGNQLHVEVEPAGAAGLTLRGSTNNDTPIQSRRSPGAETIPVPLGTESVRLHLASAEKPQIDTTMAGRINSSTVVDGTEIPSADHAVLLRAFDPSNAADTRDDEALRASLEKHRQHPISLPDIRRLVHGLIQDRLVVPVIDDSGSGYKLTPIGRKASFLARLNTNDADFWSTDIRARTIRAIERGLTKLDQIDAANPQDTLQDVAAVLSGPEFISEHGANALAPTKLTSAATAEITAPAGRQDEPEPPQSQGKDVVPGWVMVRRIGKGRQGAAVLVRNRSTFEVGVAKVLHQSDALDPLRSAIAIDRFRQEIDTLKDVKHPAVLRVIDGNSKGRSPFLVTEHMALGHLGEHVRSYRGDVWRGLRIVRDLALALGTLHEHKFIHRDVKPANIFLRDLDHAVLGDFGTVHNPDAQLTATGDAVFSEGYSPPEASRANVVPGPTWDVYMLGKVMWCLVAGTTKNHERPMREDHRLPEYDLVSHLGSREAEQVNKLLDKMVVAQPERRLASMDLVVAAIDEVLAALLGTMGGDPKRCRVCGLGTYRRVERVVLQGANLYFNDDTVLDNRGGAIIAELCMTCGDLRWADEKLRTAWLAEMGGPTA